MKAEPSAAGIWLADSSRPGRSRFYLLNSFQGTIASEITPQNSCPRTIVKTLGNRPVMSAPELLVTMNSFYQLEVSLTEWDGIAADVDS